MGQFYVKGVYSHLGLKSALVFSLMLLPFGSALQVSEHELCLQLSDFCPSMVNSVGPLDFSDSFPIQAEYLIKHETYIMSLSSILPMEMAVANVSNIMERVISLSSFKKSILVKYLCCLPRYVSFGSNGMQNICLVEPFWPRK